MATVVNTINMAYDGDGHPLRTGENEYLYGQSAPADVSRYQVWSSVLNLAVTELDYTGAKKTTKVMAGGAVIAEQSIYYGVIWRSADPVTGSSITVRQDGTYYPEEEIEPLGQLISPVEPYEEMPDPPSGTAIRSPDEPEGLCTAMAKSGVSFLNQPTVCRVIALENGTATFDDMHGVKYTITQIPAGGEPPPPPAPPGASSPENGGTTNLLATTSKAEVDDSNCPPGHHCRFIPCKKGEPGCITGNQIAIIEVRAEHDPLDAIDVSRTLDGGTIQTRPLEPLLDAPRKAFDPCFFFGNPTLALLKPVIRGLENAVGQDMAADAVKAEASFFGFSAGFHHTRDGEVIFSYGGSLSFVKEFFTNLPKAIASGSAYPRITSSLTGQKILYLGHMNSTDRTAVFLQESLSFAGGARLFGGLDISNPTARGGSDRNYIVNLGTGAGVNPGGVSYGIRLFNSCNEW